MKEKKVRKITIRVKKTPEEYSEIKKTKNLQKPIRVMEAIKNDPVQIKALKERYDKLLNKYIKQKSWINSLINSLLKKS